MLTVRFGYSDDEAGDLISIPYEVVAVIGPFLGIFLDRIGHRMTMTNLSCVLLVVTQVLDMYAPNCDKCSYPIIILVN